MQSLMKISLRTMKIWTRLENLRDGWTDGRTEKVITIGHQPTASGEALMKADIKI